MKKHEPMFLPLVPGGIDEGWLEILFELFDKRIKRRTKEALRDHLVHGWPAELCCYRHGMKEPNFSRALRMLNEINHTVVRLTEYRRYRLNDNLSK